MVLFYFFLGNALQVAPLFLSGLMLLLCGNGDLSFEAGESCKPFPVMDSGSEGQNGSVIVLISREQP